MLSYLRLIPIMIIQTVKELLKRETLTDIYIYRASYVFEMVFRPALFPTFKRFIHLPFRLVLPGTTRPIFRSFFWTRTTNLSSGTLTR